MMLAMDHRFPPEKSKKMRNCFPEVPPPPEEYVTKKVEEEYEERLLQR